MSNLPVRSINWPKITGKKNPVSNTHVRKHTHAHTHWHHTHRHDLLGHKKQSGPKPTVTSWTKGDTDIISTPRSLTGRNSISPWAWTSTSTCKVITYKTSKEIMCTSYLLLKNNLHSNNSLTSHSLMYIEIKCEVISVPKSPVRWTIHWAKSMFLTLECLPVQLTVTCWEDVWLWNRKNLSWTTLMLAYSNCKRHRGRVCEGLTVNAMM